MDSGYNHGNSLSISTLDFLLSQMSAMREIVNQYYHFVLDAVTSIDKHGHIDNDENMVSEVEMNRWRELDAGYVALEFGYMTHAVAEALCEAALLEVEEGVFVPQAVEDIFFLLQRYQPSQ